MTLNDRVEPKALPQMALLNALHLAHTNDLQDLLCSLILSECVYKTVDSSRDVALQAISLFKSQFPDGMVEISAVQFCRNRVAHKYLLAAGGTPTDPALYVAFMGTKELRDVVVDVAVGPRALFDSSNIGISRGNKNGGGEEVGDNQDSAAEEESTADELFAHGGFLSRAQGIPAVRLLLHALENNMRLVLCGHSLGGAVATLVMLRLLSSLQEHLPSPDHLRCITFGMPALGTPALGEHIDSQDWGKYFTSYALPEDPVPRLHLAGRLGATSGGKESSGDVKRKEENLETEKELVERLYKEETPSSSAADGAVDKYAMNNADQEENDVAQTSTNSDKEEKEETPSNVGSVKIIPRWSALREVARKALIAGAALPRFTLPSFLSYSHFGTPIYLFSTGVSYSSTAENANSNTSAAAAAAVGTTSQEGVSQTPPASAINLPRGILATHRMPAYRSRMLEICHKYYNTANLPREEVENKFKNSIVSSELIESFNLAPQIIITRAETSLPVLYTPLSRTATSSASYPSLSSYSISNLAVNPLRLRRPAAPVAGKAVVNSSSVAAQRNSRTVPLPLDTSTFTMRVRVQGEGLDTCTGASLRFPMSAGGTGSAGAQVYTVFSRAIDVIRATQSTLTTLNRFLANKNEKVSNSSSEEGSASGGGGSGISRLLLHALGEKFLPLSGRAASVTNVTNTVLNSTIKNDEFSATALEFIFEVPNEALLQLQLVDSTAVVVNTTNKLNTATTATSSVPSSSKNTSLPTIELNLFSDFAKTPVSVCCIPQTAWILPLDTHLGDSVFNDLAEAAQEDAANVSARWQQQGRKKQKQLQRPQLQQPSLSQNLNNEIDNIIDEEEKEDSSRKLPEEGALPISSWKEKILQQFKLPITNVPSSATSISASSLASSPPLRSVLYRGLLITDISNALVESINGDDDMNSKLGLAAELLQWAAERSAHRQEGTDSSYSSSSSSSTVRKHLQSDIWADVDIPLEDYELDSLLQKDNPSLGTRLKQQLRRVITGTTTAAAAAAAAPPPVLGDRKGNILSDVNKKHFQMLWQHLFKDLPGDFGPGPDVVAILASGDALKKIPIRQDYGGSTKIHSTSTTDSSSSSEFDLSLLDSVHSLFVASGRCHAAALLAVAASEAKDPAYRRRLSFSSGLYGRPGAVVPVPPIEWALEKESEEGEEQQQLFNVTMLQAALLAHASAAQNSRIFSSPQRARAAGSGENAVKSILRARL